MDFFKVYTGKPSFFYSIETEGHYKHWIGLKINVSLFSYGINVLSKIIRERDEKFWKTCIKFPQVKLIRVFAKMSSLPCKGIPYYAVENYFHEYEIRELEFIYNYYGQKEGAFRITGNLESCSEQYYITKDKEHAGIVFQQAYSNILLILKRLKLLEKHILCSFSGGDFGRIEDFYINPYRELIKKLPDCVDPRNVKNSILTRDLFDRKIYYNGKNVHTDF